MQIAGHARQVALHRHMFSPSTLAADVFRYPVDRYLRDGTAWWPLSITLVVRSECNVRCVMCHSLEILDSGVPYMSLDELRTFVEHLGPRNRPNILLTGGEPTLRKDILDVVALFKEAGMPVGMVTNGTLLSEERIDRLIELDLECLTLSCHGDEATHDAIMQRPGSHAKMAQAARTFLARRKNTRVIINCAITEHNVDKLDPVVDFVEELGADALRFEHLNYVTPDEAERQLAVWEELDAPNAYVNSYVHEKPGAHLMVPAIHRLTEREASMPILLKPNLRGREINRWYGGPGATGRHCTFPWRSLFVTARGDVFPCQFMHYRLGNLLEEPLEGIWNGERMVKFRRAVQSNLLPACTRCCKL